jgi:Threonine synthase
LGAQKELGFKEGIFAAPEGAAKIATLIKLIEQKQVGRHERIVCFNTGSGLKYLN